MGVVRRATNGLLGGGKTTVKSSYAPLDAESFELNASQVELISR
jgi:hypothetical protein